MDYFLQKTYSESEEAKLKAIDKAQLKAFYKNKKEKAKNSNNIDNDKITEEPPHKA